MGINVKYSAVCKNIPVAHWLNPSSRTVALGSTQHVTEMSNRNLPCVVKAADAWG
jgi:hypothetical protein